MPWPAARLSTRWAGSEQRRLYRNFVMVAEPCRLDETTLDLFVRHYGGTELPQGIKSAIGGPNDTYLPILVRMAMTVGGNGSAVRSVADIYRQYFLRLFEAQFADQPERFKVLQEAARWCLETYWKDGVPRRGYEATQLQERLLAAGALVPADGLTPPKEVQFFHDSMQSYLTSYGLATEDKQSYEHLPRPKGPETENDWDRSRVLLRAAGNPKFARAKSDLLQTGGTELFQMCLATFTPKQELRTWLRDELAKWAENYQEDLRRRDVLAAIPPQIIEQVKDTTGRGRLLAKAADRSFDADNGTDSVSMLGTLYAGLAPFVYELEEGIGEKGETTKVAG